MPKPKILLIHGWDYANYTSSGCADAWSRRSKFVSELSQHFEVVKINLPGFCGQADPQVAWTLIDYVDYVDKVIEKEMPAAILGYSFGGAIVLRWKKWSGNTDIETFLVSPAIVRRYEKANLSILQKFLKVILPKKLVSLLRDFYLTKMVKNPYYSEATEVMRETYRNIVALDLREDLRDLRPPITLIYGERDTATPSALIRGIVGHAMTKHKLEVIAGGGHDIANSHTKELVDRIVSGKKNGGRK